MNNTKKHIFSTLLITILAFSIAGCGSASTANDAKEGDSATADSGALADSDDGVESDLKDSDDDAGDLKKDNNEKPQDVDAESGDDAKSGDDDEKSDDNQEDIDWQELYLDYMKQNRDYDNGGVRCALVNVNDDDIPELIIVGDCEAMGNILVTCSERGINDAFTSRLSFSFIERGNLLLNSDGHMGYYYDNIFSIEDGEWVMNESGWCGLLADDDGAPIEGEYEISWNDSPVSKEEYRKKLDDIYDESEAVLLDYDSLATWSRMESMLDSGNIMLADTKPLRRREPEKVHRYELIAEDVDWYTASQRCQDMGGYLVRIGSQKEFNFITDQIRNEDMEGYVFWLGATRNFGISSHFLWMDNDYNYYSDRIDTDAKYKDMWLEGEPSFVGEDEYGNKSEELFIDLFYQKSKDRFVINDVTSSIAAFYPGRVAYICEYE